MAVRRVQLRRGTTAQNNAFTGVEGEITVDTTTKSIRVHDAAQAGGFDLMRADMSNDSFAAGDITIAEGVGANTLTIGANGTTVRIPGTLTVVGATTNENNLLVQDKAIVLADGTEGAANSTDSIGFIFTRTLADGDGAQHPATLFWKEDGDTFILATASVTEADGDWSADGDFAYANLAMASLTATGLSLTEGNITNVADIALDTISADDTTITINATDNTQNSFVVKTSGGEEYINVDGRDANMALTLGVVASTTTIQSNTIALGTDAANNVSITVAERSGDNAGQSLTISAGSSAAGANDNNGGDLILASGGGDGTGTSSIQFKTKVSGTDDSAERMRIHTDGTVGIGTATPSSLLHISGADTSTLTLENTTGGNGQDDDASTIQFIGNGEPKPLAQIVGAHDGVADDDKGVLIFKPNNDADPTEALRLDSALKATFAGAVEIATSLDLTDGAINNVTTIDLDKITDRANDGIEIELQDGQASALVIDDTNGDTFLTIDSDANTITLGQATTLDSTLVVNGGSATVQGGDGNPANLFLNADRSDDAGDNWRVQATDHATRTLTFAGENDAGNGYVDVLTLTGANAEGSTSATVKGTLVVNGEIQSATDLVFQVDNDANGDNKFAFQAGDNTEVASLTEAGILTVTGLANLNGGIAVDTNNFTVDGATGATVIQNTLGVYGNLTLDDVDNNTAPNLIIKATDDSTKFQVLGASGNTSVGGTLGVTGISTLSNTLKIVQGVADGIIFNSDRGNENDQNAALIKVLDDSDDGDHGVLTWDDGEGSFSFSGSKLNSVLDITVGALGSTTTTISASDGSISTEGSAPNITLKNTTAGHNGAVANSQISFQDHESKNLAVVKAAHEGAVDDFKGQLLFYTNDGDDNDIGQLALTISSAQKATFAGNVEVGGNTLEFGNDASIVNTDADLLTITEATVAFSEDVQVGGNITADQSEAKSIFNNVTDSQITIGSADTANTDTVLVRQLVVVDDIDVSGAGALTVGSTVGANNLTLGGATTTTVTAGDLTVNGGANTAVLTLGQDQAQDSEITVASRTGAANAGRSLTISAGSSATGANDLNGGNLILASGGGDGTGTSDIILNTKTSGTDSATEKVRILGSGNVGIGDSAPGTMLQVSGADAYLTLKNTTAENGEGGAETKIIFEDHGNNALAQIEGSHHGTDDDNKGKLILSVNDHDNGLQTALTIDSSKLATFAGGVTVTGDLIVQGDTTTLNVGTLDVEDTVIRLNKGQVANVNANDIGFFFERGVDGNGDAVGDGIFYWDEGTDFFKLGTTTAAHTATDFHATTTLGGLQLASLELPDDTASALNITEGNNSYLKFVTTDTAEVIEFGKVFTSQSGSKIGNLTFTDTEISSGTDAALTIKAETNLIFQADSDNDAGVNNLFSFLNGAGTEIAQINETGNLQIDGDLTVSGNDIDFVDGVANIGASVGANNLTLGGATSTVVTAGALTVNGATATIKGADAGVATLSLLADRGDDNGDGWKIVAADHATRTLTISGQNVGDADYTEVLTLTGNDTATDTDASFAGSVTVANGLDLTDSAITNVTDIALDSITADNANTITVNIKQAGGASAFVIKDNDAGAAIEHIAIDATNNTDKTTIGSTTFETKVGTAVSLLGSVVINEGGEDKDFRVEGVGQANALVVNGADGNVGIGVAEAGTMLQIEGTSPYLTLKNSTAENGDNGCETKIIFEDHGNNALGQIEVNHQDGADDEFGRMIFSTNNDSGLQTALTIDKDQLATFLGDISIEGAAATASNLYLKADAGTDAGDEWRVQANTNDTFSIGNDKNVAGTYVSILTLTGNAAATSTNATFAGEVTISGTGTNALDFSANDITIGSSIAGNTLTLGASNSTVAVAGDLTVNGGDATITAGEDAFASLVLKADEGTEAGDEWRILANNSDQFIFGNDKNTAGTYAPLLTLTGHATPASTNATFAGEVTISGTGTSALDFTNANTTIGNSIGNATLTLGAATSTIAIPGTLDITGDATLSGGDLTVKNATAAGHAVISLISDNAAQDGDTWKLDAADDSATLTINNNVNGGALEAQLTLLGHATSTNGLATFAGDVKLMGSDLTITSPDATAIINIESHLGDTNGDSWKITGSNARTLTFSGQNSNNANYGDVLVLTANDTLTSSVATFGGNVKVGGNIIQDSGANTSIEFDGDQSGITLTATDEVIVSNDLQVNGTDIKGGADEAKNIFAQTTTEGNLITLGGGGTVKTAGKLRVSGNHIEDGGNSTAIQFDGSQNTTIKGNLTLNGLLTGSSTTGHVSFKDRILALATSNASSSNPVGFYGLYRDTNDAEYYNGLLYAPDSTAGGALGSWKLFHTNQTIADDQEINIAITDSQLGILDISTVRGGTASANNTAGANLTISGGRSTGNETGGAIVFKTGGTGDAGGTANATTTALTLSNAQLATFAGNVTVSGNTITFGNGATIVNGGADTLTITEPTVEFSAAVTVGTNITLGGDIDVSAAGALAVGASVGANNLTLGGATSTTVVAGSLVVNGTSIDVDGASALTVGATVGANNLTLGGATSTVVSAGDLKVEGNLVYDSSELTIDEANPAKITVTKPYHTVDTFGDAATDDLEDIQGGATGMVVVLQLQDNGRVVTLKHSTNNGNLRLSGGAHFELNNTDATISLIYNGSTWCELTRSTNS